MRYAVGVRNVHQHRRFPIALKIKNWQLNGVNVFCFRVGHHHINRSSLEKTNHPPNTTATYPYIISLNFPQLRCGGRALRAVVQVEHEKLVSEVSFLVW